MNNIGFSVVTVLLIALFFVGSVVARSCWFDLKRLEEFGGTYSVLLVGTRDLKVKA